MSPAGSEQFTFKRHADIPKVCVDCGMELKRDDVAEVLELPKPGFRCRFCAYPIVYKRAA